MTTITVNVQFTNSNHHLTVCTTLPLLNQIKAVLSTTHTNAHTLVLLYNGHIPVSNTQTAAQLYMSNGVTLDAFYPVSQHNASPGLVNHIQSEGLNPNKFTYLAPDMACAFFS